MICCTKNTVYCNTLSWIMIKQAAGPAFGACSGVRKNITHRKQTEKQKLKIATMAPK